MKSTVPPRKKITHGITFWLRTGKVNPSIQGYKKIQKYLADLEAQLIEEGGGVSYPDWIIGQSSRLFTAIDTAALQEVYCQCG